MTRIISESLIQLSLIFPLIVIFIKKHSWENYRRVFLFVLIFTGYQIVLSLPYISDTFVVINGKWNWNGKVLGISFGILCYFIFRKLFKTHDFFTLKQNKQNFKKTVTVSLIVVAVATGLQFAFGRSEFDMESLVFQLSVPGIDEEIMYRGVLLGLLMSGMKEEVKPVGSPGLMITSVLFGLIHALKVDNNLNPGFNLVYFIKTGLAGYAWGWVTVKSRSLVMAVLSHNFSNFFGVLAAMIK